MTPKTAAKIILPTKLLAQTERFDQSFITVEVCSLEIIKKFTTTRDHLQKAATAVMIFRVGFEVLSEFVDTSCQESNLNLRGTGVTLRLGVLRNDFSFLCSRLCHFKISFAF